MYQVLHMKLDEHVCSQCLDNSCIFHERCGMLIKCLFRSLNLFVSSPLTLQALMSAVWAMQSLRSRRIPFVSRRRFTQSRWSLTAAECNAVCKSPLHLQYTIFYTYSVICIENMRRCLSNIILYGNFNVYGKWCPTGKCNKVYTSIHLAVLQMAPRRRYDPLLIASY